MGKKRSKGKSKGKKSGPSFKVIGLVLVVAFLGIWIGSNFSLTIIQGTGASLTAVNVQRNSLDLFIDGQNVSSALPDHPATWIDPSGQRVSIMAYTSDAWPSTWDGQVLPNNTLAPAAANWTLTISNASGYIQEAVFHHVMYYTVEACIRTGPQAVFNFSPITHYLTPFSGTMVHGMYDGTGAWDTWYGGAQPLNGAIVNGPDTQGALTMYDWRGAGQYTSLTLPTAPYWKTNVMGTPRHEGYDIPVSYPDRGDSKRAAITTSLVPVSYQNVDGNLFDGPTNTEILPDGSCSANSRVLDYMASKPTTVTAVLHVKGNSEEVKKYNVDYPMTLNNGSVVTIKVNTVSAVVGFSGADPLGHPGTNASAAISGLVPNVNPASRIPTFDLSKPSDANIADYASNEAFTTSETPSGSVQQVSGGVHCNNAMIFDTQAGSAASSGYNATNDVITNINLVDLAHNCGIPDNMSIMDSVVLQPEVQVGDVYAMVTWERAGERGENEWYGIQLDADWQTTNWSQEISWPYGANQTNMYYLRNYTFPVDVISERQAQAFDGNGHPILISSIFDTANNSYFYDPRADNINVTDTTIDLADPCNKATTLLDPSSWFNGLSCLWNHYWWILAAIGAFIVVGVCIDWYSKLRRK
jgi:hypothetical protein